ncbi:MAG TPA: hypothetical protein VH000_04220 [Rhizomicrobium sp.]|nr:hypothetical protein [Rhizomicrobium sp.]
MRFKLSRYQIAGLILSVIWIIGAGVHARNEDVANANSFARFADDVCADSVKLKTSTQEKCGREHTSTFATFMEGDTGNILFLAFAPLPFFWLTAFCLLYFFRAQVIGFRAVIPWSTLSWQKRAFVALCVIFVIVAGLFVLLIVLNGYVDSEVPISPESKSFVKVPANGGLVEIVGTWTRTDLIKDTIANPIQTSRIICIKSENRCTEAKAYISNNLLLADSVDYTIQSWTESAIILRNDFPCATEVYTLDLNSEIASGVGYKTNKNTPLCDVSSNRGGPDRWTMMLEDGFKVYWAERQKRRPWLLRVMQTVLGN